MIQVHFYGNFPLVNRLGFAYHTVIEWISIFISCRQMIEIAIE